MDDQTYYLKVGEDMQVMNTDREKYAYSTASSLAPSFYNSSPDSTLNSTLQASNNSFHTYEIPVNTRPSSESSEVIIENLSNNELPQYVDSTKFISTHTVSYTRLPEPSYAHQTQALELMGDELDYQVRDMKLSQEIHCMETLKEEHYQSHDELPIILQENSSPFITPAPSRIAFTPTITWSSQTQLPSTVPSLCEVPPFSISGPGPSAVIPTEEPMEMDQETKSSITDDQPQYHILQPMSTTDEMTTLTEIPNTSATENQISTDMHDPLNDITTTEVEGKLDGNEKIGVEYPPTEENESSGPTREVLQPIHTKVLKYKDGRKRTFMILHKSSFESMQDKGLIKAVKTHGDGNFHPITRDEARESKILLPPNQPEDLEKVQYTSIFDPENLEKEIPVPPLIDMPSIHKFPRFENYEVRDPPCKVPERPVQFEQELSPSSSPLIPSGHRPQVIVTWSATTVKDSPAISLTIKLPTKLKESNITPHFRAHMNNQNLVISSDTPDETISLMKSAITPEKSFGPEKTSTSPASSFATVKRPSSSHTGEVDLSFLSPDPESSIFYDGQQERSLEVRKASSMIRNNDNSESKKPNSSGKNVCWGTNKHKHSVPMFNDINHIKEITKMRQYTEFEATKIDMKRKYKQMLNKHRQKYKYLLDRYSRLEKTFKIVDDAGSREQVARDARKFLSEKHALFLESQMFLKNKDGKGNRFSKKFLEYLISLYEKSPAGYRFLRTIFTIPSVKTIHKWQNRSSGNYDEGSILRNSPEMSETFRQIESISDLLQVETLPSEHIQRDETNIIEYQELTSMPSTETYDNDATFFWQNSYPEEPYIIPHPNLGQENPVNKQGCEVQYIQNTNDSEYFVIQH